MAELLDEASHLESTTVGVFRTAATVKGGRRFSFSSLVVVGDRSGRVGFGYGKSNEVPSAIEKAQKAAKRNMMDVRLEGKTIPHEVEGRYLSSKVRLLPASPGTGVVAGSKVRSVLELAGISDCMTKCYGSTNAINTVKAVFEGLKALRTPQEIAELRGVEIGTTEIQKRIAKGSRFAEEVPSGARPSGGEGGESKGETPEGESKGEDAGEKSGES